ncbi:Holliday junction branch migration protein RuvA [Clostridium thermosuccinogenes]|jgi:Holliday junction DNA helicase RuvA|uniref:Holliday junction branch migration complex subunit RuvA n=1 Tax=Clostridium thermosuccinogenes TaxID=84032 RepID=A0A2K2FRY3_9CLOT|nr:Holliday junction branch migration protein RuvA [Pseudoclostridium thermosuccinogenes]AUS97917.1 Holliday junction branch migration protein RuvA [Pseudoclostridium thermosuccinogenes]PNT94206.1 Holliday junction branch migration protein RuvA [Pseudoclostridium thermosuccinogenes]PNU00214.1 Holliday junction branch migration protein RuvA [Pseudoclostridium thermosuccinogenes]PNU01538.1 Holliday junction branch migration protein RuvA [Pseudoclostridium thermosuccinogenes]
MIAYIKGKIAYKHNEYIIVETNGIGYKIFTSLSSVQAMGPVGDEVKMYTYLYVREDIMSLYGFCTQEELSMFELLISVSGVGPKAAVSLLSSITPSKFSLAVITDDAKTLTKAQGVGSKMAQRIILELKDKIKKEQLVATEKLKEESVPADGENTRIPEAISALMVLGYTPIEASRAVSAVYSDDMDLESIIKNALKGLAR